MVTPKTTAFLQRLKADVSNSRIRCRARQR